MYLGSRSINSVYGLFLPTVCRWVRRKGRQAGYFRAPAYKRVDIGASRILVGGEDKLLQKGVLRHLKSVWIGIDVFNLFDISNVNSYYWVTDITNAQYAVPNYLTRRQINLRLSIDF